MATTALGDSSVAGSNRARAFLIAARPTVLFIPAFAFNVSPHEAVHAAVAYLLGFNSTLFQMWVNPEAAEASSSQVAAIAASGPIFSLVMGIAGWLAYLGYKRKPAGLFFVMFAMVGVYSFLGPTAVAAFGGDFHTTLQATGASMGVQYAASTAGGILLAAFMFFMGRELSQWTPPQFGRFKAVISTTIAPWIIGTLLVVLIYSPLPGFLVSSSITGSVFWVFAVAGVAFKPARPDAERACISITRFDASLVAAAVIMVRFLAHGIRIAH